MEKKRFNIKVTARIIDLITLANSWCAVHGFIFKTRTLVTRELQTRVFHTDKTLVALLINVELKWHLSVKLLTFIYSLSKYTTSEEYMFTEKI